jgi:predicted metal-dependent hydrolase
MPAVRIDPSSRRTKTVAARWEGADIVVSVPRTMADADRRRWAQELAAELIVARDAEEKDRDERLAARARYLSQTYLDGRADPASVRWVSNQSKRWGSCTPATRRIRISDKLRHVPDWVLDAVLVHELAHLIHADHGKAFYALCRRYERLEEADVFLAGYALGLGI